MQHGINCRREQSQISEPGDTAIREKASNPLHLSRRKAVSFVNLKAFVPGLPPGALDDEDPDADRKVPKAISPVDPCSAWTAKANKRVQFGYGLNYLIDIANAVIVDVEATPARTYDEVAVTKTMITRTQQRLGLKAKRLVADTAYGTGKFLDWLVATGITPHIPVWDKSQT